MKAIYFFSGATSLRHSYYRWLLASLVLLMVLANQAQAQEVEWDRTFGGSGSDHLAELEQTSDGGYILGGSSYSSSSGDKTEASKGPCMPYCASDYWVVKLDASGDKEWDRVFGGTENDVLTSLKQTSDGGYILGGYSNSSMSGDKSEPSRGEFDYWVVKLDADGNKEWDRTFGGNWYDYLSSLQQTSDGGYILGGTSYSEMGGDKTEDNRGECVEDWLCTSDYWVVKIDANGNKEWDMTYGGAGMDRLSVLRQTIDGGYMVGGFSDSKANGDKTEGNRSGWCESETPNDDCNSDYWVVKIDANGKKEWDRTYGGIYMEWLTDLQQTSDGGYILGGYSNSKIDGDKTEDNRKEGCEPDFFIPNNECTNDYWVVKLDASGNKEWDITIGGSDHDNLTSLNQASDGGYILGGYSKSGISGDKTQDNVGDSDHWIEGYDYWVVKLDASGEKQWDRTIGGNSADQLSSLYLTKDGGVILGGSSTSGISGHKSEPSRGGYDYWVVKLSEGGCTPAITVIPDSVTYAGGNPSTILLGYGHQQVTLQASGAEQYEWSPGEELSSTTVANPIFTPTAAGTYIFTVTGRIGSCSAEATVKITVIKPDVVGNIEWDRTLGGNNWDRLRHIEQTSDGGYILGGSSLSGQSGDKSEASRGDSDYWVVKLDAEGNKVWDRTFGGGDRDEFHSLQQTSDGGYILGGASSSGISGDKTEASEGGFDYWVVKLDADGNKVWDKTFGGSSSDWLYDLQQTADGGYMLGGTSASGISGDKTEASRGESDFWVVKIDANGNKEWDRTFGGDRLDNLSSLDQTADGGYILGGTSDSNASGDKSEGFKGNVDITLEALDYWVVKLDAGGNKEWDRTIGGHNWDSLNEVKQTSDGGYILGGSSVSGISGDKSEERMGGESDFWVVKLDEQGNKVWDRTYGGDKDEQLSSLVETADGGYLLGGTSYAGDFGGTTAPGEDDFWLVRINANGDKQWDRYIGGDGTDVLSSMDQAKDGGVILGGSSTSGISGDKSEANKGFFDYWVVKLSPAPTCAPPTPAISVVPTSDVYTGGDPATLYLGYGPQSVRLAASGAESYAWSPAEGLSSATAANPIFTPTAAGTYTFTLTAYNGDCSATTSVTITVVDVRCGKGKVLVCHKGKQICISTSAVAAHLRNHKQDRLGSCSQESAAEDAVTITLPLRVFPNPFRDWAEVAFSLPVGGGYRLELYSANGKMVGIVAEGQGQDGQQVRLELRGEQLREGVYYLKLITPDKVQTVRLILKK